jgi:hypothetical protein
MLPLTVSGQPLEISLERLGQSMSLYVPLSKGPPDRRAELRFPNWTRLEVLFGHFQGCYADSTLYPESKARPPDRRFGQVDHSAKL